MNATMGGDPAAMPAVSKHTRAIWNQLRLQISPFNSVITIDGHLFSSLSDADKHWISSQYRSIVNVNVIYVHDADVFRIFLARADMFPAGSLLPVAPGNLVALINPALLNNIDLPAAPIPTPLPKVKPVERNNMAKHAKILRPPNAFILYRKAHHEAVKAAHPGIHNNQISVILGTQWQREDPEVRAQYKLQAAQLKKEHMEKHPDYQYQPRKASELKRRMTKKKAAALAQNEAPTQDVLGTGNSLSDHDFSKVSGNWKTVDLSSITPGCTTAALFDHVHQHNTQQELNHYLEGSSPELFVTDTLYKSVWEDTGAERDAFEEFINCHMWTGIDT